MTDLHPAVNDGGDLPPQSHDPGAATVGTADPGPRPVALKVRPANIPAELQARRQWLVWKYTPFKGKWTKPPYQTNGQLADSTRPETWTTFDAAYAAYHRGGFDGIGYVPLADEGMVGGDADGCRDPRTGEIGGPDAAALKELRTYTEVSPSGTGLRAVAFGRKPGRSSKKGDFELYDGMTRDGRPGGRFLTFTGHCLPGSPAAIERRQDEIDRVYRRYFPETDSRPAPNAPVVPLSLSDEEVLRRAFANQKNGTKIRALFDGASEHGSPSEADLALCCHLAWWFRRDAEAVDRVFRTSGLMREKWARDDYRERTIARAIASVSGDVYDPTTRPPGRPAAGARPPAPPAAASETGDGPRNGAEVILAYFRALYKPVFRVGTAISTEGGDTVPMNEATGVCDSKLIKQLEEASDAPRYATKDGTLGAVKRDGLPGFYRKWVRVAWGDLLNGLPDEDGADIGPGTPTAEAFRQAVRDALMTQLNLGEVMPGERERVAAGAQVERRSIIDWCHKFAKSGTWRSIRSYRCWCRTRGMGKDVVLQVAIRHELFGQLKAAPFLCRMTANAFGRRATRYGIGRSARDERPHGLSAVVLDEDFVTELLSPAPEDAPTGDPSSSAEIWSGFGPSEPAPPPDQEAGTAGAL